MQGLSIAVSLDLSFSPQAVGILKAGLDHLHSSANLEPNTMHIVGVK